MAPKSDNENGAAGDAASERLIEAALDVLERAYSPYSKVRIGAALEAHDGRVFSGCNVENASYGLTLCAERVALFKAVSEGVREFKSIAIVTDRDKGWMPCGACRQTLYEFAPDLRILIQGRAGERIVTRLGDLLPDAFDPNELR